jgi:hypothetical protein
VSVQREYRLIQRESSPRRTSSPENGFDGLLLFSVRLKHLRFTDGFNRQPQYLREHTEA